MTELKDKITLTEEQATLLITLYIKALETQRPDPILEDPKALEILSQTEYDFTQLKVPVQTRATVLLRARKFDEYTREFLNQHSDSIVLHLGCGLDSRCMRVKNDAADWYDLDLQEVIELRRKYFTASQRFHMIAASVTDPSWIGQINYQDQPVLVVAEGLMMYLHEEDVKAMVLRLQEAFPGCHLAFDVFSQLTAKRVYKHPSLQKTGASIFWGIDDAREIESWADGIRLQEEWFFTQSEAIAKFDFTFRLAFQLAGLIPAARKAHRLLFLTL